MTQLLSADGPITAAHRVLTDGHEYPDHRSQRAAGTRARAWRHRHGHRTPCARLHSGVIVHCCHQHTAMRLSAQLCALYTRLRPKHAQPAEPTVDGAGKLARLPQPQPRGHHGQSPGPATGTAFQLPTHAPKLPSCRATSSSSRSAADPHETMKRMAREADSAASSGDRATGDPAQVLRTVARRSFRKRQGTSRQTPSFVLVLPTRRRARRVLCVKTSCSREGNRCTAMSLYCPGYKDAKRVYGTAKRSCVDVMWVRVDLIFAALRARKPRKRI